MRELVVFTESYFIHSRNTSKLFFRSCRNLIKNIVFNNFECIYRDNGKCGITRKKGRKENSNARTNVLKELLLEILLVLQTTLRANNLWPLLWLDTTKIENETSGNAYLHKLTCLLFYQMRKIRYLNVLNMVTYINITNETLIQLSRHANCGSIYNHQSSTCCPRWVALLCT